MSDLQTFTICLYYIVIYKSLLIWFSTYRFLIILKCCRPLNLFLIISLGATVLPNPPLLPFKHEPADLLECDNFHYDYVVRMFCNFFFLILQRPTCCACRIRAQSPVRYWSTRAAP